MGGWPRGHRRSADIKEIGFPGPFFTPPPRNSAEAVGMAARGRHQKSRPAASNPACCPGRASYLTRSRGGCPARQAGPGGEAGEALRHADAGFPLPGQPGLAGGQRLACHRAWPARVAGAAGPAYLSPGPARKKAGRAGQPGTCPAAAQPLCRRTWPAPSPAAIRRGLGARERPAICPRRQPAGERPGCCASARHRGQPLPRPAIPVPGSPAFRQSARRA